MEKEKSEITADSIFGKRCLEFSQKVLSKLDDTAKAYVETRPGLDEIFHLSELAFMLSTVHEESCFVSCRIVFIKDGVFNEFFDEDNGSFLKFDKPIELNLMKIRKLAMAADPDYSMILVERNKQGKLVIFGIQTFPNMMKMMKYFGMAKKENVDAHIFNIHIKEPGIIEACAGYTPVVRWNSDKIIEDVDEKIIESCSLIREKFEIENNGEQPGKSFFYATAIDLIARYIDDLKHGGTLLVLKDKSIIDDTTNLKIKYKVGKSISISKDVKLLQNILESDDYGKVEISKVVSLLRVIDSKCHFIAHLSCVDGAVVITQDLSVLGFGAEIVMPKTNMHDSFPYYNLKEKKLDDLIEKGTRHRSAYRFCKKHPSAFAFVISQDGGVSCMVKSCVKKDKIPANTVCIYHY